MFANADVDLSRSEDFERVGDKYIRIAAQLVASVESDHLLSLLLETPTDIAHLSSFEIAIKYGIEDFMDDSRIQMLMAHMWRYPVYTYIYIYNPLCFSVFTKQSLPPLL